MSKHDNLGSGALWSNKYWEADSPRPKWTGKIVADRDIRQGEEIPLAVWPAEQRHDNSPKMRLKVDRYERQRVEVAHGSKPTQPDETEFDDGLPF